MNSSRLSSNSINDAVSIIDVHDLKIVRANNAFLQQYGLKEEQVIGKACYEVIHKRSTQCTAPDDICPLRDTVTNVRHSVAEHIHYAEDGEVIYVEVSISPIWDYDGRIMQVVHVTRDITGRRQAEEALKRSEENYRGLFEGALARVVTTENQLLSP